MSANPPHPDATHSTMALAPTHSPPFTPKSAKLALKSPKSSSCSPKLTSSAAGFVGASSMLPPSSISKHKSPKPSPLLSPKAPGGSPRARAASPRKKNSSFQQPLVAPVASYAFVPPHLVQYNSAAEAGFSHQWLPRPQMGFDGLEGAAAEDNWAAASMELTSGSLPVPHFYDDGSRMSLAMRQQHQLRDTQPHFLPPPTLLSGEQFLRPDASPLPLLHDQLLQDSDAQRQVWDDAPGGFRSLYPPASSAHSALPSSLLHHEAGEQFRGESFAFDRAGGRGDVWRGGAAPGCREDLFFNDASNDFMSALDAETFSDGSDNDISRHPPPSSSSSSFLLAPQLLRPEPRFSNHPSPRHNQLPANATAQPLAATVVHEASVAEGNAVARDFAALFYGEDSQATLGHTAMYFMQMSAELQARAWKGGVLPQNLRKRCKGCTRITARCCSCDITIGVCHMCWPLHARQHGIFVPPGTEDREEEFANSEEA